MPYEHDGGGPFHCDMWSCMGAYGTMSQIITLCKQHRISVCFFRGGVAAISYTEV